MPYIRLSIAKKIEPDVEQKLVKGLGEALSKIPGRTLLDHG
jgi:phenylpyruvate tautomerase PptA (4-oxalocrotonate tautomerase family)